MQTLRVSLVQGATRWHDPAGNRAYYGDLIAPLAGSDLVLLPETFTSGFSNEAIHNAETMDGPTVAWLSEQARKLDAAICGSVQLRVDEKVYNRLLFATPDGNIRHYDKRHLFRYADEHKRYAAGGERLIVEWRGWRICPLVCYDLRFPVYSRNRHAERGFDYDLLLYVANWPSARRYAWQTLLRARAIENLAYVAAPAQGGQHINGRRTWGQTLIASPWGEILAQQATGEGVVLAECDWATMQQRRQQLPALKHRVLGKQAP